MREESKQFVLDTTQAQSLEKREVIQSLWSGYGEIARYKLLDGITDTIIVKHVQLPDVNNGEGGNHPRGWNTSLSHQRKIQSYKVECAWYEAYSALCNEQSRVAKCYGTTTSENEFLMVLEDLDANGFSVRKQQAIIEHMQACLKWLANFHEQFLFDTSKASNKTFKGIWDIGCYWHLDTRPDELDALTDLELKQAAPKIDQALRDCKYQTLVHGDAKLANFCFSDTEKSVATVDFQYVGRGCGMKDLAYFIGSCLDSEGCEKYAGGLLDFYFKCLEKALVKGKSDISFSLLEKEWRSMYAMAWADFQRFLKGWSPDHWKIHKYSETITKQILNQIQQL